MIKFTIIGNPVPYLRMTQGEVWLMKLPEWKVKGTHITKWRAIQKYLNWKEHVKICCLNLTIHDKPKEKIYMNIMIYFKDKKHGDPDNIWKGIADAIFLSDKYVVGSFDMDYDSENPRCEVEIFQ